MSRHPNVILKCTIKAEGTTRKLLRDLLKQNREEVPDSDLPLMLDGYTYTYVYNHGRSIIDRQEKKVRQSRDEDQLAIGYRVYHTLVMEDDYDESWQISGKEGDLIIFDLLTYGYGDEISWVQLQSVVSEVDQWARDHYLDFSLSVTANYW